MTTPICFTVLGEPQGKGSMRAFTPKGWNRPILTSTNKGLKAWEQTVAAAAQSVASGTLILGAVSVAVTFYFSRPKSLPKKITRHVRRPDLDKLIRGATDALTNVIWKDDSQVVLIVARKEYTEYADDAPKAVFQIDALEQGLL